MDRYNLISLCGLVVLMLIAWAASASRWRMNWRAIIWGVVLQLVIGAVVFLAPGSTRAMVWFNDAVVNLLGASQAGQEFLFGPLGKVVKPGASDAVILAFQVLPLVIFFSAIMGLLYYWRIMPLIIRGFAWAFTRLLGVSGAESLCTASNIFVGVEANLTIRPYLPEMTRSEYCTILTAGMATVASTTMGIYVLFLQEAFPTIAGHLISASLMSAPAAIVMSKIIYPETGEPLTLGRNVKPTVEGDSGSIEAIVNGAMAGVKLLAGIVAMLIAFLGILALVNLAIGGVAGWFGADLSLQDILSWVMYPLTLAMGVPPRDAVEVAKLLGERLVATEIPAYKHLATALEAGAFRDPRSPVIAAYALCGFAHVASLAIFAGGVSALVPHERRKDVAAVGLRALLAATLACLMTGAVAGVFFHGAQTVFQAK